MSQTLLGRVEGDVFTAAPSLRPGEGGGKPPDAKLTCFAMRFSLAVLTLSVPFGPLVAQQTDTLPRDTLPPVFVYGDVLFAPPDLRPLSATVLHADRIQRGRATLGLDEALQSVPGVFVANRYNYSLDQRISIRGFGARSAFGVRGVQVLVDGIPQTLPDGQGQLTNIELNEVESIEVLRGPASTLLGNASGGVISVHTRPPGGTGGGARSTLGSFGFKKQYFEARLPVGQGGVSAGASLTTLDGWREHSGADLRHYSVRWAQPLWRGFVLNVTGQLDDNPKAQNPGALTLAQLDSAPRMADPRNVATDAGKAVQQQQLGMGLRRSLGRGQVEASLYTLHRDLKNPLNYAYVALDRWAYGARASATIPFPQAWSAPALTAGVDVQWQRDGRTNETTDRSQLTLDQLDRVRELGPYAHVRFSPLRRLTVVGGVRVDAVRFAMTDRFLADGDQSGTRALSAVSWATGLTVDLTPAARPFVNVGTSFETPTTTEFINRADGLAGLNPNLAPQHAISYELGIRGTVGGQVHYTAAVFHMDVTDELIPFDSPVEPGRTVYRNAGSANHQGVELSLDAPLGAGFSTTAAYTLADYRFERFIAGTDTLDGNLLPGVPRHRLYAALRYMSPRGVWAMVEQLYNSAVYANDANSAASVADAWWTTQVRVGWTGHVGFAPFTVFGALENLFDQRYVGSVAINAFGGRYFESAPGRTFLVGAQIDVRR